MPRTWGKSRPISPEQRRRIQQLFHEAPELPLRLMALRMGVSQRSIRKIHKSEEPCQNPR